MKNTRERPAGSDQDPADNERPSDAEFGIGEETEAERAMQANAETAALQDLLDRPEVKSAVETLVAARVKELALPERGADTIAMMGAFAKEIAREIAKSNLAVQAQQPGHVKPLAPEEVEARAAAYVEMKALLARAIGEDTRAANEGRPGPCRPQYLLQDDFYDDNSYLWPKGDTIIWYGPPNTDMQPQNEAAYRIFNEMMRWIGGAQTHISDQVAEAQQMNGRASPLPAIPYEPPESEYPTVGLAYKQGGLRRIRLAERVDVARQTVGPSRVAGTIVPEMPASVLGGPNRLPGSAALPETGTVMPNERPSPAQSF